MLSREGREVLGVFRGTLQRAVAGVTPTVLTLRSGGPTFNDEPVRLGRSRAFALAVNLSVTAEPEPNGRGRQRVRTVGYAYGLHARDGRELLVYHWHPNGPSPVVRPHLHLGSRLLRPELARTFGRTHWPTEHVALTAVLRASVEDLGVEPLRDDWRERLTAAETVLAASLD